MWWLVTERRVRGFTGRLGGGGTVVGRFAATLDRPHPIQCSALIDIYFWFLEWDSLERSNKTALSCIFLINSGMRKKTGFVCF